MTATIDPAAEATTTTGLQVEVPMPALLAAFTWAEQAAVKDRNPGQLTGLHLTLGAADAGTHPRFFNRQMGLQHPAGYVLTLAATDRYRLAWTSIELPDIDPATAPCLQVDLHRLDLQAVVKAWGRPTALSTVTISGDDSQLQFEAFPTSVRHTVMGMEQTFPTIDKLLPDYTTGTPGPFAPFAFNPAFLKQVATAAHKLGNDAALQVAGSDPGKAFALRVNGGPDTIHHCGLLMPVRMAT